MSGPPSIDVAALRDELVRRQPPAGWKLAPWMAGRVAVTSAGFYAVAFAFPALLSGSGSRAFTGRVLWFDLGFSLLFGVVGTAAVLRGSRGPIEARVQRSAHGLEQGWARMTRGRWALRVLGWAIAMAAAIGLIVGTILVARLPRSEMVGGSPGLTLLTFFAATLAWSIPVTFAIRWFWLRWARRFIVAA